MSSGRPARRLGAAVAWVAVVGGWTACASTAVTPRGPSAPSASAGAPWELPAGVVPSQRLFQGSYEGPEGGGSFRATLRLVASDRFRLDASDRLGRLLWSLSVEHGRALWVDHRGGTWCPDLSRLALPGLGTGPLPASAVPALLLGALPAAPAGAPPAPTSDGEVEVRDDAGRHWTATLAQGRLAAWRVSDGGRQLWWWRRQGRGGLLSQNQGRQLRWQEVVAEPLRGELVPLVIPSEYRESCVERPEG